MPHINVNNDLPGIRGLMAFRPETADAMGALANILLRDDEGISRAERELIATHVSYLNDCFYCHSSHGATACQYLDGDKALVAIAASVQKSGKAVTPEQIEQPCRRRLTNTVTWGVAEWRKGPSPPWFYN